GESGSPVTSPCPSVPKSRRESKEALGVPTMSTCFPTPVSPTLRQPISTWTAGGHRLAPRRASDGWTAAPVAPARLVCQAYHRCPGCMGCRPHRCLDSLAPDTRSAAPPRPFPYSVFPAVHSTSTVKETV